MDGWSVNTLGHRRPPISSSYPWCNTRPHRGCQDFYRNCSLLHLCACVCGVSVPPRPGNLFQTLSCSPRPCSISHHLLDNLRKQRSENRQRGLMRPFWWKCWQYLHWNILTYVTFWDVARLPYFPLVCGEAPDYFVVGARISAEVVLANVLVLVLVVLVLFVIVRLWVRPLLTC